MAETWMIVEVEDSIMRDKPLGDGVVLRYRVSPRQRLTPEDRPIDEIVGSACDKGFECAYTSMAYPGVPPWVWKKVEQAVMTELRAKFKHNIHEHAVSITPVCRLTKY